MIESTAPHLHVFVRFVPSGAVTIEVDGASANNFSPHSPHRIAIGGPNGALVARQSCVFITMSCVQP
jgi:hypothetical protein